MTQNSRTENQIKNELNLVETYLENLKNRKFSGSRSQHLDLIEKIKTRIANLYTELEDLDWADVDTADLELNPSHNNPYFYNQD